MRSMRMTVKGNPGLQPGEEVIFNNLYRARDVMAEMQSVGQANVWCRSLPYADRNIAASSSWRTLK
jgi:hypothetical protein